MIIGVGVDLVDVKRFESKINQTSGLTERIFTSEEIVSKSQSLAGYWAAKEALIKVLGNPTGLSFQDVQIVKDGFGKPSLEISGATEAKAKELGITSWHLSISHDAGMAVAIVIAEGSN